MKIRVLAIPGFERVVEATEEVSGLHCFVAIHSTKLGPSLGGVRIYPYDGREEALSDVLRLAQAMTRKSSIAQTGLGGGKAVIIAEQTEKSTALLHAFAQVVNTLNGNYITAEDVGSTVDDMTVIHSQTPYVAALPTSKSSGDPSRYTAWGVFRGMEAVAETIWGSKCLKGKRIAIQGLGSVGAKLAEILFWRGAELLVCDIRPERCAYVEHLYGAQLVDPEDICSVSCDIFSPCAMGRVICEEILENLRCSAIAGSANNQLASREMGKELAQREILYAPDYVINAGGIINVAREFDEEGYQPKKALEQVDCIYDVLQEIFVRSKMEKRSTVTVAEEIALRNLEKKIGKRLSPIAFRNGS